MHEFYPNLPNRDITPRFWVYHYPMNLDAHLPKNLKSHQIEALYESLKEQRTHSLVLNPSKESDEAFLARFPRLSPHPFLEHVYSYKKEEYDFGKMALYDLGCYSIQDSASMLPAFALSPRKGEKVLDLCAAPGGKTILLSLLSRQGSLVIANDISLPRAKELSRNVERMGLGNVIVTNDDFAKKSRCYDSFFDCILLDAPCSGSAMARKNAQAEEEWSEAKMARCLKLQSALLEVAYPMLKQGGRLVYATCSFCYEEDEGVLASFLSKHEDIHPQSLAERQGYFHGETIPEAVYLFPSLYPGEGQFFCLLKKEGGGKEHPLASKAETPHNDFFSFFGLQGRYNFESKGALWSLPFFFPTEGLSALRLGLKVASSPFQEPDHALSRYLAPAFQVELSEKEALSYLKGETFPLDLKDGYYLASYSKKGLGFFKMAKGKMKNRYPKGLRRNYKFI